MRPPPPAPARRRAAPAAVPILAATGALLLAGCGGDATAPPPPRAAVTVRAAADSIYLSDSTLVVARFSATADAAPGGGVDVAWTSSDTSVVWLTAAGRTDSTASVALHPRRAGAVTISVRVRTSAGATADASTTVVVRPTILSVWPDTNALVPGLTRSLTPRGFPDYTPAAVARPSWTTDAPSVATVDAGGTVTAVAPGRATITATLGDHRTSAVVVVRDYGGPLRFTGLVGGPPSGPSIPAANASPLSPGLAFTCGLATDGRALCWGSNAWGQLGSAGAMDRCEATFTTSGGGVAPRTILVPYRCSAVPTEVDGGLRFTQLGAAGAQVCGVASDGAVYCWGKNFWGQAGTGRVSPDPLTTPARADAAVRFRQVAVGGDFVCALATDGAPYCWGHNRPAGGGLLGTGSTDDRIVRPAPVQGGMRFATITAGETHACALTDAGEAWCWGDDVAGQLGSARAPAACAGDADTACYAWSVRPRPIATTVRFRELRAGYAGTCGLAVDGGLWCWGAIGVGSAEPTLATFTSTELSLVSNVVTRTPVRIDAGATFASLAGAPRYAWVCGVSTGGTLQCVTRMPPSLGSPVVGGTFTSAATDPGWPFFAGARNACGIGTDGITRCWASSLVAPVPVPGQ